MPLIARRVGILFAVFFGLLGVAAARSAYFATVKGDTLRSAATTQQVDDQTMPARRGTIVDRRGVELAVSQAAADVNANPGQIPDKLGTARRLAPLLRRSEDELLRLLNTPRTGFVYLARALPAGAAQRIADLKLPGIAQTATTRRTYPRTWLASQVLGSVGIDGQGLGGLEYRFDDDLRGTDGERRVVKDALGQAISIDDVKPARSGDRLELNLDAQIQSRTEQVLSEIGRTFKPTGATAIVMDPRSGALLAVANYPQIDANEPSQSPDYARQNRAVAFNYEPGSTFKAVTVAGALADKVVTPDTTFQLEKEIQVADRTIGEAEGEAFGTLSTRQILARSSNVGAIKIGRLDGSDRFAGWIDRFGFGRPTGVDLPGEQRGIVLPRSRYSGSSMGNLPIGQGTSVTPMQIARAYAAIANGGKLVTPQMVRRIGGRTVAQPPARRVIPASVSADLRSMLQGVFNANGTAAEVSIKPYKLAGKTGTANKVDRTTGEYSTSKYISSFVGFAPAQRPRLLVSVMVDEPIGEIYGGAVAAPAFRDIMRFALTYLKIPPA